MWTRRQAMVGGCAGLAGLSLPARAFEPVAPKRLLLVLAYGGWDTSFTIDPKPDSAVLDSPPGTLVEVGGIPILDHGSRPAVRDFFERWGDRTAVIKGIETGSIAHVICHRKLATGSGLEGGADIAARIAEANGITRPLPYLILGFRGYAGPLDSLAGRIGTKNQLRGLLDPTQGYPAVQRGTGFRPTDTERQWIREWQAARVHRERALRGQTASNARALDDFTSSMDRATLLRGHADLLGGSGPGDSFLDRARIALDAFATGLSQSALVEVGVDFDTHRQSGQQAALQDQLFAGLSTILTELDVLPGESVGSSMLDETVVVTMSEMTRTPRENSLGGKDHWPWATVMVHGNTLIGGRVHGVTDEAQRGLAIDLATGTQDTAGEILSPTVLLSTIQALCGAEPDGPVLESVLL